MLEVVPRHQVIVHTLLCEIIGCKLRAVHTAHAAGTQVNNPQHVHSLFHTTAKNVISYIGG